MKTPGDQNRQTKRPRRGRGPWLALVLALLANLALVGAFAGAAWLGVQLARTTTEPIRLVMKPEALPKAKPAAPAAASAAPQPKPEPEPKPKPKRVSRPKPRALVKRAPEPEATVAAAPEKALAVASPSPQPSPHRGEGAGAEAGEIPGAEDHVVPVDPGLRLAYMTALQDRVANGARTYPRRARRMGIEGDARLAFTVRADGSLAAVEVVESAGSSALDQAAKAYVQSLAPFPPFPKGMSKQDIRLRVTIEYHLQDTW